jgi:release factor glutamine methyltransferase
MNDIIKNITTRIYKPLLQRYLSSTRVFRYRGLRLLVHPDVFHPGFFYSSKFLLRHVSTLELKGKSVLELGAGSGLISFYAAREGARVTATDINPTAVDYLEKNKIRNRLPVRIIHSDLFGRIPPQHFDIIALNPPYYRGEAVSPAACAWYSGKNREYFRGLFDSLGRYVHARTVVCMVLCKGSEEQIIRRMARDKGWEFNYVLEKKSLFERNCIIHLEAAGSPRRQPLNASLYERS